MTQVQVGPQTGPKLTTPQFYNVLTGVARQYANKLEAGALLYNTDANNAVWLAATQAVAPNYGMRLGPLGTATWNGGPIWAVVDTGVATPVQIAVSPDVTQLTNPVDVASAVAAKLLIQGVPSVSLLTTLTTVTNVGNNISSGILDVHLYASVMIRASSLHNFALRIDQYADAAGTILINTEYITCTDIVNPRSWHIPLSGIALKITTFNNGTADINYTVIGSNRTIPKAINLGGKGYARTFQFVGATTNGSAVQLNPTDGDSPTVNFNYNVYVTTGYATATGLIQWRGVQKDGHTNVDFAIDASGANKNSIPVAAPPLAVVFPIFLPSATAATSTIDLRVAQGTE
jgi:hypothetical protein